MSLSKDPEASSSNIPLTRPPQDGADPFPTRTAGLTLGACWSAPPLTSLAPGVSGAEQPAGLGDVLSGYEVLGELGRGGMGVVYRARQLSLNRLVALKMVLAGLHAGPAERQRFRAEAEVIARLQHPNIVQVYE